MERGSRREGDGEGEGDQRVRGLLRCNEFIAWSLSLGCLQG